MLPTKHNTENVGVNDVK